MLRADGTPVSVSSFGAVVGRWAKFSFFKISVQLVVWPFDTFSALAPASHAASTDLVDVSMNCPVGALLYQSPATIGLLG